MGRPTDNSQQEQNRTPLVQKFCCGVGHVMNDLWRGVSFTYTIIFMIKVAGLTGIQAGYILLVAQLTDSFCGALVGYCSDKLSLPLIARCVGRRKAWHMVGTILMAICFSLAFTRCLFCQGSSDEMKVVYYGVIYCVANIAFPAIDVGHLAVISVVGKTQGECISLNVLRTFFTYLSGICAYAVTWIILGAESEAGLSESSWKEFTMISVIASGIGLLFSGAIFHLGTREPKDIEPRTKFHDLVRKSGLISVAMIFTLGTNVEEEKNVVSFPLRKISSFLSPFDQTIEQASLESGNVGTPNTQEEGRDRKVSEARKISTSSRKALNISRKISTFLVPFETDTNEESERKISVAQRKKSSVVIGRGMMTTLVFEKETDDDDLQNNGCSARKRRLGMVSLEKEPKDSYGNEGFEVEDLDNENAAKTGSTIRKSSFPAKIVNPCHIESQKDVRIPISRKQLLKSPQFYVVGLIYTLTRLMQDAGYSYMAFYLTDYLEFPTTSIAYFPLILLVSGLAGTVFGKLLNGRLGSKWTYCLAAALIMGAAVSFYFITSITHKAAAYVLMIFAGIGMSSTFVMALAFLTKFIGDNKETAGFVFSIASFMAKMTSGAFYIAVQSFYPTSGDVGSFARHVFSFSLGLLAFLGFVIVVFSQKSDRPAIITKPSLPEEPAQGRGQAIHDRPSVLCGELSIKESVNQEAYDTRL